MKIRWITPNLGTAPAQKVLQDPNFNIIDVRELVDKAGNPVDAVRKKIVEGCESLREEKATIVCCDYGISRSNAIAVGILAMFESIPFEKALHRVLEATGEKEIKIGPLQMVRLALGGNQKKGSHDKTRVLVTGSTGFIGKSIVQKLSNEVDFTTPVRNEIDLSMGSTQLDLIARENEIDCIIHAANPRVYTSNVALGNSLTMLRNVLDVCVASDIPLIYLSNWEVYSGYRAGHLVVDEAVPLLPKGPYGEAKYLCEMLIEHSRRTQGLRCTLLRPGPVYGIGCDRPKFIYNFIEKIKRSQAIVTHQYNNGRPSLDLLYIDDLVTAIGKAISSNFNGNLNIGTSCLTTTTRVAEILCKKLNGQSPISSTPIDSDTAGIALDSSKARSLFGWQPAVSVEQGFDLILTDLESTDSGSVAPSA